MDRSEPSLVPEWLKGTSGGSASSGHHIFSATPSDNSDAPFASRHRPLQLQSSGATRGDYCSPRYSGSSERPFLSSRRSLNTNSGGSDRTNTDRDPVGHSRGYASFRRSSSVRVYDSLEREKDWESGREWEAHDRERFLGGVNGNDRSNTRELSDTAKRWSNSGPAGRFESDSTLRRSRSAISNSNLENGEKKFGNEMRTVMAAPLARGGIVSNMQKAAFEKDFPYLGAEERQGIIQSNPANVAGINSSSGPIWQGQGPVGRPGTPVSGVSSIGVDGWKSALADAPVPNGFVSLGNGPSTAIQQIAPGSLVASKGHGLASTSGLNMAEALVQNPPRPRTPQLSIEVQRMEVLALKQSRQLIPVTPSMPKTMGLSPSEKSKAKSLRPIDTTAAVVKGIQSIGSSHPLNSPKVPQGGKLLVLKPARETGSSVSVKPNNGSPVKGGNTGSSSFGVSAAGAFDVSGNASLVSFRKQKPHADPRAISSSGVDSGLGPRGKEVNFLNEEKKSVSQAQNRSDFFNALRRKAYEGPSSTTTQDKSNTSTLHKTDHKADQENENVHLSTKDLIELKNECSVENVAEKSDIVHSIVEIEASEKNKTTLNGFVTVESDIAIRDTSETGNPASANRVSVKVGSEEEEAAFLRSLGWEEDASGEEALTEEEINSFYQEHMRTVAAANAFREGGNRLWNLRFDMHVGNNVESLSSGIGSSESA